jgi:hypothetical protein
MAQPFRAYAKDLLEAQVYPKISPAPGVPPRPPYDVAGWSLGMQMGIETIFIARPFEARMRKLDNVAIPEGRLSGRGTAWVLSHEANNSLVAVNRLLKANRDVSWLTERAVLQGQEFAPGAIVVRGQDLEPTMKQLTRSLGIDALAADVPASLPSMQIRAPKTALYQPWGGNIDEGWTRWILEQYEFPYTTIHPEDVRSASLSRFDAVLFPDMNPDVIVEGAPSRRMPPDYKGGIEASGVKALRRFVEDGGTLITLGQSSLLPINSYGAPFRDGLRSLKREEFFCPGSVLRVMVDVTHPIGYGMKDETNGYFINSAALEPVPSFSSMQSATVVRYPNNNLLRSGWLQGESYLTNKIAVAQVRLGKGRMILMPLRVQHRAQTHATFKLLFNAILTSAAGNVQ